MSQRGSWFDLSSSVLLMFSSKKFTVSGFTVRSLIHLEFIFVCGVRKCFNFILLHVTVQFSQHHLLKRLSLPHASFVKTKVPIDAWVYFWLSIFYHWSVFLCLCQYHSVLMTVALEYNLQSGRLIPPAPIFFLKTSLANQDLCVSIWIVKYFVAVLWKMPLVIC